jgi:hypothetical protein
LVSVGGFSPPASGLITPVLFMPYLGSLSIQPSVVPRLHLSNYCEYGHTLVLSYTLENSLAWLISNQHLVTKKRRVFPDFLRFVQPGNRPPNYYEKIFITTTPRKNWTPRTGFNRRPREPVPRALFRFLFRYTCSFIVRELHYFELPTFVTELLDEMINPAFEAGLNNKLSF